MTIPVSRKEITLYPDPSRVITRFFMPGEPDRARSIIEHVVALEEERAGELLDEVLRRFSPRHRNISKVFEAHYERVRELIDASSEMPNRLAKEKRLLIGAYFTREYSIEAAAFYNPSIVEDPYQGNLLPGQMRVILSFRGTGENHISSIVFRSAVLDENNDIEIETPGNLVDVPEVVKRYQYRKREFLDKLEEMHIQKDVVQEIMNRLGERFSYRELQNSIDETRGSRQVGYTAQKVIDEWDIQQYTIPASAYDWNPEDTLTVTVSAQLFVRGDADDEFVGNIASALVENFEELQGVHGAMKPLDVELMAGAATVPYHPAAQAVYSQAGF